ncbi:MAG TPA: PIG-L family deacetylase [Anaerolineales bacterium]|nr:PIG-L family deacetylase [Anaerolineales bacterium]
MRWIYLSPHLDDAVLSAGGLIYEQTQAGIPVEIWTFMCGYPQNKEYSQFAEMNHSMWGFSSAEEAVDKRRAEDKSAAAILGAKTLHFDYLDCIYRRGPDGEWLYSEIAVPPHPADADLPSQIAKAISAHLLPDDVLVCQLSVGSHVDHVLVRQAADLLGKPLRYDIDVPYIFYKPQELEQKSAGMKESVHSITETGLKSWKEAVLEYKSQIPNLGRDFDSPKKARESIQAYWSERKGIRLFELSESSRDSPSSLLY